jgi:tRNA(Ile)-lysidine synthase
MLLEATDRYTEEHALLPPPGEGRVVAGLSGGVDSVVLVHLLRRMGHAVTAAHVNYGMRAEAAGDEALARRYCASFEPPVPLRVGRRDAEARADRRGTSLQEAAREQRYAFFHVIAQGEDARHVAVGHHRDDQAETLLLNLARGSGPEGLAGMRPKRRLRNKKEGERKETASRSGSSRTPPLSHTQLVRPLLGASRDQIEAYAREHELPWREDAANRDARFKRAALRRDVLPALEAHFPGASERLARAAELMRGYVDESVRPELRRRFEEARGSGGGRLRLEALRAAPSVWQGRLLLEGLRRWCPGAPRSRAVARELRDLLDAQPGRHVDFAHTDSTRARVWREREVLRFVAERRDPEDIAPQSLAPGRPACLPGGIVRAERLRAPPDDLAAGNPRAAVLDAEQAPFPLAVRPWRDGDRFQPLGMDGHTLVSDLLTDAEVPPSKRRRVPVVCDGEDIVWVAGHRLAEKTKVRPSTRRVARLTFEPAE